MHWVKRVIFMLPFIMVGLWLVMFTLSRILMFYSEYQHTDLCLKVEQNARRSCVFVALNTVINSTYLCGYKSCADINEAVQWVLGLGTAFLVAILALALLFPTLLYPIYSAQLNRMADRRVMSLYHTPYGMDYYMQSHRYPLITEVQEPGEDVKKLV